MRRFWGYYTNKSYAVGCNGGPVYIYDRNGNELAKFRDFPYAYTAAFCPNRNIIAVKSTDGYIGFYDLESLSLIKKYNITRIGAQDEGFAFSGDGKYFYNIEKPIYSTDTQLGIYETTSFTKNNTLFEKNKKMVLDDLEFDTETGICYVSGFMRNDDSGVLEYGFVAIFDRENQRITNIHPIDEKEYTYLCAHKSWEIRGFTEKSLEWNYILKDLKNIKEISIKEVYNKTRDLQSTDLY